MSEFRPAETGQDSGRLFHLLALILLPLLVVIISVWQGAYNSDAHHWGLMLSNAIDLVHGKVPYKDIFIQYGFLTTLIQGAAVFLLGENLRAIILVTAIAYAAGLYLVYPLSLTLSGSRRLALYAFVSAVLLHPLAIYPWSNYVAFPFLVGGCLAALSMERRAIRALLAGILLGLAVLCREGLFPAAFIFCGAVSCVRIRESRSPAEKPLIALAMLWAGFFLPIAIFFIYIWQTGVYDYWHTTSVILPRLYAGLFLKDGMFHGVVNLGFYFLTGFVGRSSRILFLGLIVMLAGLSILGYLLGRSRFRISGDQFLVSLFSVLLLSASFHLNEIFRLATGVALGSALIYIHAARYRIEHFVFGIFCLFFVVNLASRNEGNYFYPTRAQKAQGTIAPDDMPLFAGQRWPLDRFDFYRVFQQDMVLLKEDECQIRYYANDTTDVFLAILAPFDQYQLAPFGRGRYEIAGWEALRPEFDVEKRVRDQQDIVLFSEQEKEAAHEPVSVPKGYVLARRYAMPEITYRPVGNIVSIMVPEKCTRFITTGRPATGASTSRLP